MHLVDQAKKDRINATRAKTLARLLNGPLDKEVELLVRTADTDGSGDFDKKEIEAVLTQICEDYESECELPNFALCVEEFWVEFDTNGDGKISKAELKNFLVQFHTRLLAPLP